MERERRQWRGRWWVGCCGTTKSLSKLTKIEGRWAILLLGHAIVAFLGLTAAFVWFLWGCLILWQVPTPRFLEECHGNVIKKLFRVKKLWPPNKTPKDIKYVEKRYVLTLQNHKLEFELQTHGRGVRGLLNSNLNRNKPKTGKCSRGAYKTYQSRSSRTHENAKTHGRCEAIFINSPSSQTWGAMKKWKMLERCRPKSWIWILEIRWKLQKHTCFSHKQHFANTSRRAKVYGKTRYNLNFFVPFLEQIKNFSPGTDLKTFFPERGSKKCNFLIKNQKAGIF